MQSDTTVALDGWPGSYEAIIAAADLQDGTQVRIGLDVETVDIYGDGSETQDLPGAEFRKFAVQTLTLDFDGAFEEAEPTPVATEPCSVVASRDEAQR